MPTGTRVRVAICTVISFGLAAVVALAWWEQTNGLLLGDGSTALISSSTVTFASLALLLVVPLVLYDFVRWLVREQPGIQSVIIIALLIVAGFAGGYVLGLSMPTCLKEFGVPDHPIPGAGYDEGFICFESGSAMFGIGIGLIVALLTMLLIRLTMGARLVEADYATDQVQSQSS